MLEIRLLGPLEVRDGERVVEVRRRKQRALLAALALRPGSVVSTDRLVDELWGDDPPRTARHALENYVSELRKLLGRDVIATTPGGYGLAMRPEQVDVVRFERLVAEARVEDPSRKAELLREALGLLRGPPLVDLSQEPFAEAVMPRLAELEISAREELVDADLELGRHADAIPDLEQLVAAHPFRERLRGQLMLALYRSGRQADALSAYQDTRRVLVDELGIDPSEDLQELERAILRQDSALRAPERIAPTSSVPSEAVATSPPRPLRKTVTVLVAELGNVAELARTLDPEPLRAILDRFRTGVLGAVERHEGASAGLAGDAVRAVFGVPVVHEDDALRALRAAHEGREGIGVLNDGLLPEHGVFLEVGTALATGEVLVTPDGDEVVTGRPVAEAEQLAQVARPGQILLAGSTHDRVRAVVEAQELSFAESGGIAEAVRLVELLPDSDGRELRLESPLVGRRRQLAALASAFENAVASTTVHLFTLLGAPGVGKTRLVREFVSGVESVATLLHGRCLPYGERAAYRPLLEAIRVVGPDGPELDADPVRAVRTSLERVFADSPLVLVLDDMQWAGAPLLDLVETLAESPLRTPLLVVCVARPELLDERPTWGGGKANATSFVLEPLGEAESDRLLDNLLGESDIPEPIRDWIVRTADGNPLFVEELLATLVERDVLRREAGLWTTTTVHAVPLPPTIQALVAARVDRLDEPERVTLELASVIGKEFALDAVSALAPDALRRDIESHLDVLLRKELVRPRGEAGSFEFRHQLIRDAAYGSMPMQVRADLHARLADFLERTVRPPELADIVAYHRDRARGYRAALGQVGSSVDTP